MRVIPGILALSLLAGCATTPGGDRLAQRDPLEGFNRGMWAVNDVADKVVLKPVSTVYRTVTPKPARRGLSRVLSNLSEPWNFVNAMLQGKPDRAFNSLGRFAVNTTIGVGGLADHATKMGMKQTPEDFGQTLASWGANAGPYLVLPLLGPSTLRDGVGMGVAQLADPYRVCLRECGVVNRTERWAATGFEVIDARANLTDSGADGLLASSADPYAVARSAYLQRRRALIADQDDGAAPAGDPDAELNAALDDIGAQEGDSGQPSPEAGAPADAPAPDATPEAPATAPETPAPATTNPPTN